MKSSDSLLDLVGRLAAEVGRFVDQRFELFKAELRQEAADTARRVRLLVVGTVGASAGAMLLLLALGLWVGDLVGSRSGGLAIVGGGLALAGGGLVLWAVQSLGHRRLIRDTVGDLRRDAEWIRHEV